MTGFQGLDPQAMYQLAGQLDAQADRLNRIISRIEFLVSHSREYWQGRARQEFDGAWHQHHKRAAVAARDALHGLAQSIRNNAAEQHRVSSRSPQSIDTAKHVLDLVGAGATLIRDTNDRVDTVYTGLGYVAGLGASKWVAGRYTDKQRAFGAFLSGTSVKEWQKSKSFMAELTHFKRSPVLQHLQGSSVVKGAGALQKLTAGPVHLLSRAAGGAGYAYQGVEFGKSVLDGDLAGAFHHTGSTLKSAGIQGKNPALYLAGVIGEEASLIIEESREIEWGEELPNPLKDNNWRDIYAPGFVDSAKQLRGQLGRIFL